MGRGHVLRALNFVARHRRWVAATLPVSQGMALSAHDRAAG